MSKAYCFLIIISSKADDLHFNEYLYIHINRHTDDFKDTERNSSFPGLV